MSENLLFNSAMRIIDWTERHVVPHTGDSWDFNANQGRFAYEVWEDGYLRYCASWGNALGLMTLLLGIDFGNRPDYEETFNRGLRYLKSQQDMDHRHSETYGAIREYTSYTSWIFPRDGVTAAWFFLLMYYRTRENEWLDRADLFGQWLCRYGLDVDGWPEARVIFPHERFPEEVPEFKTPRKLQCQIGSLTYLVEMYRATNRPVYKKVASRIFEMVLNRFQDENGIYFGEGNQGFHSGKRPGNDDFASIGMIACELELGLSGGLDSAILYANALVNDMKTNRHLPHSSAYPIAINLFCHLDKILGTKQYAQYSKYAAEYLIERQWENICSAPRPKSGIEDHEKADAWAPWVTAPESQFHRLSESPERMSGAICTAYRKTAAGQIVYGACSRTNFYSVISFLRLAGVEHPFMTLRGIQDPIPHAVDKENKATLSGL